MDGDSEHRTDTASGEETNSLTSPSDTSATTETRLIKKQRPRKKDMSEQSNPNESTQRRKAMPKSDKNLTSTDAGSSAAVGAETGTNEHNEATSRRKRRARRARTSAEGGGGDEAENSFLVEMSEVGPTSDEEVVEPDEEMGIASDERESGPNLCLQGIIDVLKIIAASWLHFGLVLVPFPIIIHAAGWHQGVLFIFSYLSLFPLASVIKVISSSSSRKLPAPVFTILRVMLRNSLPLIIGAFAVHNSLDRLVQGMLMGLLMHRLFLCLGTSILIAANRSKTRKFDDSYTRIAASFLYLSMILIILPTILRASSPDAGILGLLKISRWCAVFLLLLLGLLLFYTLKTETKFWSNADELGQKPKVVIGTLIIVFIVALVFGILASWLFVRSSIWVSQNWGLSYTFIAGILLPIALNAVDGIDYARISFTGKIKSITLDNIRSSLEICLYLTPILVIAGWIAAKQIGLYFFGMVAASGVLAIINLSFVLTTLRTTWFHGTIMMVAYLLFAVCYFLQNE